VNEVLNKSVLRFSLLFLGFILILSIAPIESVYAVSVVLDASHQDIGDGASINPNPKIAFSGDNVYTIWQDGVDIIFSSSSDTGATHISKQIGTSGVPQKSFAPQLDVSGNSVYTIWSEDKTPGSDVIFKASTDNGDNFGAEIILSSKTGLATNDSLFPELTTSNSNVVHAVWYDKDASNPPNGVILYKNGGTDGANFDANNIIGLGGTDISEPNPQIAVSGNDIHVVWETKDKIRISTSTDGGAGFSSQMEIGDTGLASESSPQVSALGNNVHVVWQDGSDIKYVRSTDRGVSFSTASDIGDAGTFLPSSPQITALNPVYVVWKEEIPIPSGADIKFRVSTDGGASLENDPDSSNLKDLSNNAGTRSTDPKISASGDILYVVWADDQLDANFDIFMKASDDQGDTFSSVIKVSENTGLSSIPEVSGSDLKVYVTWKDDPNSSGSDWDIFFRAATLGGPEISFDNEQYRITDSAQLTIVDDDSNTNPGVAETIVVPVTSTTDTNDGGIGISVTLTEDDVNSGIFVGALTFNTASTSGSSLKVTAGDTITASHGGNNGIASIFPKIIVFDKGEGNLSSFTQFDPGQFSHVKVIDQNSNVDANVIDTVSVDVTSTADPVGITLILSETGINTGIFGGCKSPILGVECEAGSNLIFLDGNDLVTTNSIITITQEDIAANADPIVIDTTTVSVSSTSDPAGFTLTLQETGLDTGIFSGPLELNPSVSVPPFFLDPPSLLVNDGDFVTIQHDGLKYNTLVTPNPNPANGAIQVLIESTPDEVTASFNPSVTVKVFDDNQSGGGGGGLVRPGFVVNALAGAKVIGNFFGGGGGGGNSPPLFGESSFAIISGGDEGFSGILNDNDANTLDQTMTFKVGEKVVLRFDFIEGGGIGKIEHIGFYTNIHDGQKKQDSDTYIYYEPLKSPSLTVHDPNGLFSETSFDLLEKDATSFVLKYELTFAKPMAKSDIILESWNTKKWSTLNEIPNAIEVVSSGILQTETLESEPVKTTFLEDVTDDKVIPVWVKSNAKWWSENKITSDSFISGIEYLVNEGIIIVPDRPVETILDTSSSTEMPSWIKMSAGWWADEDISENEFITSIEWLISNNIIRGVA